MKQSESRHIQWRDRWARDVAILRQYIYVRDGHQWMSCQRMTLLQVSQRVSASTRCVVSFLLHLAADRQGDVRSAGGAGIRKVRYESVSRHVIPCELSRPAHLRHRAWSADHPPSLVVICRALPMSSPSPLIRSPIYGHLISETQTGRFPADR